MVIARNKTWDTRLIMQAWATGRMLCLDSMMIQGRFQRGRLQVGTWRLKGRSDYLELG